MDVLKFLCELTLCIVLPSVLWHCWLDVRKSIRPAKKLSGEELAWLSVCSRVQMICTWCSWCHCHPIISCSSKIQNGFTFLAPAYPGCRGQKAVKQMSSIAIYTCILHWQRFNVHLSGEPGSAVASWFLFTCSKSEPLGSTWCSLYRPDAIPVIQSPVWEHWRDVYIRHCMCCSFVVCQYVIYGRPM